MTATCRETIRSQGLIQRVSCCTRDASAFYLYAFHLMQRVSCCTRDAEPTKAFRAVSSPAGLGPQIPSQAPSFPPALETALTDCSEHCSTNSFQRHRIINLIWEGWQEEYCSAKRLIAVMAKDAHRVTRCDQEYAPPPRTRVEELALIPPGLVCSVARCRPASWPLELEGEGERDERRRAVLYSWGLAYPTHAPAGLRAVEPNPYRSDTSSARFTPSCSLAPKPAPKLKLVTASSSPRKLRVSSGAV